MLVGGEGVGTEGECVRVTLSKNQPADDPLLLCPMVTLRIFPKLGASMVNLSSVPFSKLFLSLSKHLSPATHVKQFDV